MSGEIDGVLVPALGRHGERLVATRIEPGVGLRLATHNFCDPCTWWHESVGVVAGACTNSGDDLTYTVDGMANDWIIDLSHKRLTFEDAITEDTVPPGGVAVANLVPTVLQDGVPLAQALEGDESDPDRYTLNYGNTTWKPQGDPAVVFAVARNPAAVITLSYRKAVGSGFIFDPPTGKRWVFEDAEVDHTSDLNMNAAFVTEVSGSKTDNPPNGTAGTLAVLGGRRYNNVRDFHTMARGFRGPLPANLGVIGGVPVEAWTWEWKFMRADEFYDSLNYRDTSGEPDEYTWNQVRAYVDGDQPYPGHYMTLTYYGQESDEDS